MGEKQRKERDRFSFGVWWSVIWEKIAKNLKQCGDGNFC
jgi:hypothetical protein